MGWLVKGHFCMRPGCLLDSCKGITSWHIFIYTIPAGSFCLHHWAVYSPACHCEFLKTCCCCNAAWLQPLISQLPCVTKTRQHLQRWLLTDTSVSSSWSSNTRPPITSFNETKEYAPHHPNSSIIHTHWTLCPSPETENGSQAIFLQFPLQGLSVNLVGAPSNSRLLQQMSALSTRYNHFLLICFNIAIHFSPVPAEGENEWVCDNANTARAQGHISTWNKWQPEKQQR